LCLVRCIGFEGNGELISLSHFQSKDFWLLLKALHDYTSHPSNPSGLLPISSSLPDMHTSTASYIALQKLYKDKAREDLELFRQCLQDVLKDVGLDEEAIGAEDVEAFVKHCHTLLCERGNRLKEELEEGDVAGDFRQSENRLPGRISG
jgi:amyloid beta precursor protein binding protein 1